MDKINFITVILVGAFLLPVILGAFQPFSRGKVQYSFTSLFDGIEFLFGIIVSLYFTKKIFIENNTGIYRKIYLWIPEGIRKMLYGLDIFTYLAVVPLILIIVMIVLRIFTAPLYRYIVIPLSDVVYKSIESMNSFMRSFIGALWQVPRAIYSILIIGILINFYAFYFPSPLLNSWMNESIAYQEIYKNAINPVLNSNIAKKIPVLVNDSFSRTMERIAPVEKEVPGGVSVVDQLAKKLADRNIKVTEYFNGVTMDQAIKSSPEIDEMAKKITKGGTNDKKRADLIYNWITQNIKYDYNKAEKISKSPIGISSGAIDAFGTRKGVCFDYASLYVAMCRAVGLKVRLVTGMGYSGVTWGDHAWNQAYSSDESRWINVDSTFGTAADYFDKSDFNIDHKYADVQGEW